MTLIASVSRRRRTAWSNNSIVSSFSALSLSGRLRVTIRMPSVTSVSRGADVVTGSLLVKGYGVVGGRCRWDRTLAVPIHFLQCAFAHRMPMCFYQKGTGRRASVDVNANEDQLM